MYFHGFVSNLVQNRTKNVTYQYFYKHKTNRVPSVGGLPVTFQSSVFFSNNPGLCVTLPTAPPLYPCVCAQYGGGKGMGPPGAGGQPRRHPDFAGKEPPYTGAGSPGAPRPPYPQQWAAPPGQFPRAPASPAPPAQQPPWRPQTASAPPPNAWPPYQPPVCVIFL